MGQMFSTLLRTRISLELHIEMEFGLLQAGLVQSVEKEHNLN